MSVVSVIVAIASVVTSLGSVTSAFLALIASEWRYVLVRLRGLVVRSGTEGLWRTCEDGEGCRYLEAGNVGGWLTGVRCLTVVACGLLLIALTVALTRVLANWVCPAVSKRTKCCLHALLTLIAGILLLCGAMLYATQVNYDAKHYTLDRYADFPLPGNVTVTTAPASNSTPQNEVDFRELWRRNADPGAMKNMLFNLLQSMMADMASSEATTPPEVTTQAVEHPTEGAAAAPSAVVPEGTTEETLGRNHERNDYFYKAETRYCYQLAILAAILACVSSVLSGYLSCRDAREFGDMQRLD